MLKNVIRSLIVDDEELARKLLQTYADRLPHLEVVAECKNPLEALVYLQRERIDLLLLDIQMPELTGIEFLKTLPYKPIVIFTTAYPDFALEGYSLDAVDYLLKPFSFERFVQGVNKASELLQIRGGAGKSAWPAPDAAKEPEKDYIMVRSEHKIFRIRYEDILYIQGMREYVAFQTVDKKVLSLNSLKQLEQDLPTHRFVRSHKSYIISLDKVDSIEGNMLLIAQQRIPIGTHFREEIMRMLLE
ncbi:MAG: response regulator transcription factor [Saprospiraceae bacterium]|nr:response regulator transcription factor [Saprospiraceae bacterium]